MVKWKRDHKENIDDGLFLLLLKFIDRIDEFKTRLIPNRIILYIHRLIENNLIDRPKTLINAV